MTINNKLSLTCSSALYNFRYASNVELLHTKKTYEDTIASLCSDHVAAIGVITNKLSETEEILKLKIENLFQVENEKESVIVDLSFTEQELKEEKLLRAQDDVAAKLLLESLVKEKKSEFSALRHEGQERMQLLIDHHEVNLSAEIGNLSLCVCVCGCYCYTTNFYMFSVSLLSFMIWLFSTSLLYFQSAPVMLQLK